MHVWSCAPGSQTGNVPDNTRETQQKIHMYSVKYCTEQENVKRKCETVVALFTLENYRGHVLQWWTYTAMQCLGIASPATQGSTSLVIKFSRCFPMQGNMLHGK